MGLPAAACSRLSLAMDMRSQAVRQNGVYIACGLVSRPRLNGSICVVTGRFDAAKGRWPVRFLESNEEMLLREANIFLDDPADAAYAAKRAFVNAMLHLRVGVAVEGPCDADAAAPASLRLDRIRRLVHHLGHELSSNSDVKFVVTDAAAVRLIAARAIPRGTVILQLPANLCFSAEGLSNELGLGSPDRLRDSIKRGIPRAGSSSAAADLHNHLFYSDRQQHAEVGTFLQVCLMLAARQKLRNAQSSRLSPLMRVYVACALFQFKTNAHNRLLQLPALPRCAAHCSRKFLVPLE